MFLKIEVLSATAESSDPPNVITHYLNPHTAAAGRKTATTTTTTCCWSLGRKAPADCLVRSDKTISREHIQISIHHAAKYDDGFTVTATNKGKLGSFLVIHDDDDETADDDDHANDNNDGGGADSDATPDEQAVSQMMMNSSQATDIQLSETSRSRLGSNARLQPIELNETIPLEPLNTTTTTTTTTSTPVVIQCGRTGTTIILSWMGVTLAASGNPAKVATEKLDLASIGATVVENVLDADYVVTTKLSVCTKQLTAYCRGIPLVQPSFVRALLLVMQHNNSSTADPWPAPADHAPKPDGNTFWTAAPHNSRLWSCYTLARVDASSAVEQLVEAAGIQTVVDATTVLLDGTDRSSSGASASSSSSYLIAVQSSLAKSKKLKQQGIPTFTAKQIAQAITQQRLLQDGKGNTIGVEEKTPHGQEAPTTVTTSSTKEHIQVAMKSKPKDPPKTSVDDAVDQQVEAAETSTAGKKEDTLQMQSNDAENITKTLLASQVQQQQDEIAPNTEEEKIAAPRMEDDEQPSKAAKEPEDAPKRKRPWQDDSSDDDSDKEPTRKKRPGAQKKASPKPKKATKDSLKTSSQRAWEQDSSDDDKAELSEKKKTMGSQSQGIPSSQRFWEQDDSSDEEDVATTKPAKRKASRRRGNRRWQDSSSDEDEVLVKKGAKTSFFRDPQPPTPKAPTAEFEYASQQQQTAETTMITNDDPMVEDDVSQENQLPSPPPRRLAKQPPAKGWITKLPKERLRSKEEIMELTGATEWIGAATTEIVATLVTQQQQPAQSGAVAASQPSSRSRRPNFKAFRKNTVPPVYTGPPIRLQIAKHAHQVDDEEEAATAAIEAQQRLNDELFGGGPAQPTRKRGRRR